MDSTTAMTTAGKSPLSPLSPLESLPAEIHRMVFGFFCSHCCPAEFENTDAEEKGVDDLIRVGNTSLTLRSVAVVILLHQPHKSFSRELQISLFDLSPQIGSHVKVLAIPFDFQTRPTQKRVVAFNKIARRQIARFGVNLGDDNDNMNSLLLHHSLENELALSFATGVKILKLTANGPLEGQFEPTYVNSQPPKYVKPDALVPKGGRLLSLANRGTYAQGKPESVFPHLEEIYCDCHSMGDSDPPSPGLEILRQIVRGTPVLKSFSYTPRFRIWPGNIVSPSAIIRILAPRGSTLKSLTLKTRHYPGTDLTITDGSGLQQLPKLEKLELCEKTFCPMAACGKSHRGSSHDQCLTRILPKTVKTLKIQFYSIIPDPADVVRLGLDAKKGRFPALETFECVTRNLTHHDAMMSARLDMIDVQVVAGDVLDTIRDAFEGTGINVIFGNFD